MSACESESMEQECASVQKGRIWVLVGWKRGGEKVGQRGVGEGRKKRGEGGSEGRGGGKEEEGRSEGKEEGRGGGKEEKGRR